MLNLALMALGCFLALVTFLSVSRSPRWWIRCTDFPRVQISTCLIAVLGAWLFLYGADGLLNNAFVLMLVGALTYQCIQIFPYTLLARRQVREVDTRNPPASIRLLISNVLMTNRRVDEFLRVVGETQPNLILAVETDDWWDKELEVLSSAYPHFINRPQNNTYGMHLYSALELDCQEVRFLVEEDVPSIYAAVRLRSGDWVDFFGMHPRPPKPQQGTEERDAEILIVGRQVGAQDKPAIVAGDLNDVAWSHTTRLFQRTSGTLDPRRGRGMFSTFHAKFPPLRWPLDHVFHDPSFKLVSLKRLRDIGSDHFPILVELQYECGGVKRHETPHAEPGDRVEGERKIADARGR